MHGHIRFRWGLFLCVSMLLLPVLTGSGPATRADTFYPMLMSVSPVAVQAGQTTECEVNARYSLQGAYKVFVTGEGVTGEVEGTTTAMGGRRRGRRQGTRLRIAFKAAADAMLGPREVRIATPQGVSTVGQIVVVRDPIVREAANNDTLKTAQSIPLPATVCGALEKAEDVDFYKFTLSGPTALTFHVQCQRLQNKIHDLQVHADPLLTLRNAAGTVLAANDNFFFGDPLLHYRFPSAGEYFLEVRDSAYGGNGDWQYCIEIHDRPFVTNVFPSRVTPGTTAKLQLIGHNLPADATATLSVPANMPEGLQWAMLKLGNGQTTNAAPIIVSRLPEAIEAAGDHASAATAQKVTAPVGISGRIDKEGEVDCYSFEAKAGERFTFAITARSHQSEIDPFLRILNAKGERLAENDDFSDRFVHADSRIENWTAPAAGRYVVEIKDTHLRGGPGFVYFLEISRSQPHFLLEIDTDKTLLAPGIAAPIFVRVTRKNGFEGPVQLAIDGLPPGVTATCGRVLPAPNTDGCIIVRAAADAKQGAANIRITGTATHPETKDKPVTLTAVARPLQEVYMPGGGRYHWPVETHAVSVGAPLDLKSVKITPAAVTLKPGESKKVEIAIERSAGFKSNVTLDTVYQHLGSIYGGSMPPGVSIDEKASQTLLTGDQSKGYITLKAAADAKPVEGQLVPIMAHVSINFVMKFTYCEPVVITVVKP